MVAILALLPIIAIVVGTICGLVFMVWIALILYDIWRM